MSAISLKSITGITSITTPDGVDNQLTLHTNNTTERVKIDVAGNVHVNNHLAITGVTTTTDNINIDADNKKLQIGDGQDLQLFHDGGHSRITNTTGILKLTAPAGQSVRVVPPDDSGNVAVFHIDGSTHLYYDSSHKFSTLSDGIEVVGNITMMDSLIHRDDTNTKIRFPANDTISFETAGSEKLRIDSGGQLIYYSVSTQAADFGTGAAGGAFHKYDLGAAGATIGYLGSANNLVTGGNVADFVLRSQGNMILASGGGTERLRIASGGQVIIGDDDIDKANGNFDDLIVGANASTTETHGITIVCGNAATNGGIAFSDGSAGGADAYRGMITYQHNDNHMHFRTNAVERLRIDSSGRLLVGTTAGWGSNVKLHLANSTNTYLTITSGTSHNGVIAFSDDGSERASIDYDHDGDFMVFKTNGNTGERLRIASNGKIHVKGNGGDSTTDFSDAGTFFNLKHDTYGGRIGFSNGTASAGVTIAELLGYWGSNKVAGLIMNAGGDATNRDDGMMSFYTQTSGSSMTERFHIGTEGQIVAGYRVGTSTVRSNQPVAFHSARVSPDASPRRVSTGQRCNLFVGSNSGWAAHDGGTLGLGGSETGGAGVEAMWTYIKGGRQSGNGWEYAGYFELGTSPWSGLNMAKRVKIYADGQIEIYPTDSTFFSTQIGGAQRLIMEHTGGGNIRMRNTSSGTVTYSTSSDYRLKENATTINNALSTVKALKPYQFTWKHDNKLGQGFFAHEAQAVLPDIGIVSGTKDGVHTKDPVKDEHHKKGDPIYQSVDYAKLVPLLTAALQEETAKREALEARVAALEGS